jgi:uncharacterized protein
MTTMLTHSGLRVDLLDPKPEQITMVDIAHHLAHICRFTGATDDHYSVAQHSVVVANLVPKELFFAALLHDAHEAYIGDISTPVKQALGSDVLETIRIKLDVAICARFSVERDLLRHRDVKHADLVALATERRDLMPPDGPEVWPMLRGIEPQQATLTPLDAYEAKERFLSAVRAWWQHGAAQ